MLVSLCGDENSLIINNNILLLVDIWPGRRVDFSRRASYGKCSASFGEARFKLLPRKCCKRNWYL